jgi:hypothetical protein
MSMTPVIFALLWLCVIYASGGVAGAADAIYFKDGMRTVCHGRAWEENDQVICEYDGGLLSYPRTDVDHIEKGPPAAQPLNPSEPPPQPTPALSSTSAGRPPASLPEAATTPSGVPFYDPRRARKYASTPDRMHDSYPEAISALAQEIDRPPQWIEEHMGESNDLGMIRETLAARKNAIPVHVQGSSSDMAAGIEFYNPRRPEPYWTGPQARHTAYTAALEALGREFGKPVDWVERCMGDSNDLEVIRSSLRAASSNE